jgi:F420-dependent oxidoreductase-like protein
MGMTTSSKVRPMEIGLVVEGQDGLDWQLWRRILTRVDRLGFSSLFRSDHYFIEHQKDSLELFLSLVLAATETTGLRFGPLVTPVTFRRPVDVARLASQIDSLSGGRFVLGLGIGWYKPEHDAYGIPFPSVSERFERLEEAIAVCRLVWGELPATFDGRYYSLKDVDCRPKPVSGRVPIIIGGTGEQRTLKIVAQYADEWCSECLSVEDYARKVEVLDRHCESVSRDPASIRRSMVIAGEVVPTARSVVRGAAKHVLHATKIRAGAPPSFSIPPRMGGLVVGGRQQIIDELAKYSRFGLQEAVFRYNPIVSDAVPEYLAAEIMPSLRDI